MKNAFVQWVEQFIHGIDDVQDMSVEDIFWAGYDFDKIKNDEDELEFMNECKGKFSLCWECDLHNKCPRYKKHREEEQS